MGLFAPWFLAGALAVSLPIYLHLLRRLKNKQLPFSSLRFFERRTESSVRQRRLRFLTLFALRVAMLLLLALAFAKPYFRRTESAYSGGTKQLVIALDQTFSMRAEDRLTRAKQQARQLVQGMGGDQRARVVAMGTNAYTVAEPTTDRSRLLAAIDTVTPGDGAASYGELVRLLRMAREQERGAMELHLFSDFQKGAMPNSFGDLTLPPGVTLVPHNMVSGKADNWYVESVTAPAVVFAGGTQRVQATISSTGEQAAQRNASLVLNGRVLETKPVSVPAHGRATVEFGKLEAPHGLNRGEVRVEPTDPLAADNVMRFSVERADPRKILFVNEGRQARSLTYYQAALTARENAFTVESSTPEQASRATLANYGFVVLSDVGILPASTEEALARYVRAGGALLVAAGPATAARGRIPVAELTVTESRYAAREGERFQSVTSMDQEHPAFRRANAWQGVRFYQATRTQPNDSRVLARLGDETPILVEKRVGEGRVLVFASTLDNIANDFPLHASFVPFVEQTAAFLAGVEGRQSTVAVGSAIPLRSSREQGSTVEVLDPAGKRALSLRDAAQAQAFAVTSEGYYEVRRGNGRNELVAVNADRRESDITPLPPETLSLWQASGTAATQAAQQQRAEERVIPLWWYLLGALLVAAVAESIYASRYLTLDQEVA